MVNVPRAGQDAGAKPQARTGEAVPCLAHSGGAGPGANAHHGHPAAISLRAGCNDDARLWQSCREECCEASARCKFKRCRGPSVRECGRFTGPGPALPRAHGVSRPHASCSDLPRLVVSPMPAFVRSLRAGTALATARTSTLPTQRSPPSMDDGRALSRPPALSFQLRPSPDAAAGSGRPASPAPTRCAGSRSPPAPPSREHAGRGTRSAPQECSDALSPGSGPRVPEAQEEEEAAGAKAAPRTHQDEDDESLADWMARYRVGMAGASDETPTPPAAIRAILEGRDDLSPAASSGRDSPLSHASVDSPTSSASSLPSINSLTATTLLDFYRRKGHFPAPPGPYEEERLRLAHKYGLDQPVRRKAIDRICALAKSYFRTKAVVISLCVALSPPLSLPVPASMPSTLWIPRLTSRHAPQNLRRPPGPRRRAGLGWRGTGTRRAASTTRSRARLLHARHAGVVPRPEIHLHRR